MDSTELSLPLKPVSITYCAMNANHIHHLQSLNIVDGPPVVSINKRLRALTCIGMLTRCKNNWKYVPCVKPFVLSINLEH